jgi:hypothetical protein
VENSGENSEGKNLILGFPWVEKCNIIYPGTAADLCITIV